MTEDQAVEVELVGGPRDGERYMVRGKPLVLRFYADYSIPMMSPRLTPVVTAIKHIYLRDADGRYEYEGDE